jgi:hypothetical protein
MSVTPRKAASLLSAAALGVTAMTGVGWAAGFGRPSQREAQLF